MNESEYLRLCAIKLPQSILFYQTSVRGYHDYMSAWPTPKRGELLSCIADPKNPWDQYAIAIVRDSKVVGHLPYEIAHLCFYYI